MSYNRRTKKAVPLAWSDSLGSTGLLWASRDGSPRVLLQRVSVKESSERWNVPEVVEVDPDTGVTRVVQRSNPVVSSWEADAGGVVRLGSSYDRETGKLRVLYRPDARADYHTVLSEAVDRYQDAALPSVMLTNGKAYAYSRKDGYRALYAYDLSTMKLGAKVFGTPGYDIASALVNPAGDAIDGVGYVGERSGVRYLDGRLAEIQRLLEAQYGRGIVTIETADRAREAIVFSVAKAGQSPSYYVYNTVKGDVQAIGYQNETLKRAQLNAVSVVRYRASDGKSIEAVLTMPRHRAGEKNLPVVVLPHGGPWARDSADWDPYGWAQALAEIGYVVIQPNFRGSAGYGAEWEKAGEHNWGYRMSDDLNDAVAWAAGKGIVDAKRACVMGWSYGGYAAARAAQRDGAKYRCAIAGAAPVDMPAMVNYDRNYLGRYGAKTALGSASTDLADISPGLHAEQVSIPILIVHGAKDQRVPVAQARGFVSRLKKAGKVEGRDFVYLEQPQNTHNLLREADRVQFLVAVRDFLAKHNPA